MFDVSVDVRARRAVVFFTGAGLSAESGLETYRGPGGIWEDEGWQAVACQRAFELDPDRVWEFHESRRRRVRAAEPSVGHRIVAEVQALLPGTRIVTQNVDGLHQRAGSRDVIELHGNLGRVRCPRENRRWDLGDADVATRRCACGAWLRPDIVWFEDPLDEGALGRATEAMRRCDLLISVGTSGTVFPAAHLPHVARESGALCIEVNPEPTAISDLFHRHLREPASRALARLWPAAVPAA